MIWQFVALLAVHWFADFGLQTHWQASNKSKNLEALTRHVTVYTAVLAVASLALFGIEGLPFAVINGCLHFGTDYFTSRWSSRLFMAEFELKEARLVMKPNFNPHNFFVIIGLDQLIHQATLAVTMAFLIY